jgi:integrating conjugative element protein (TIGR03749 family)
MDLALDLGPVPQQQPSRGVVADRTAPGLSAQARQAGVVQVGAPAVSNTSAPVVAPSNVARPNVATKARPAAKPTELADMPAGLGFDTGDSIERIVFQRSPIRVVLTLGKERMVTFPSTVAFHSPEGFEGLVQSQIIERTAYLTALAPFGNLRVVAEDLTTGRLIPIDFVVSANPKAALPQVEVLLSKRNASPSAAAAGAATATAGRPGDEAGVAMPEPAPEPAPLDMVALTRYASQALYAPRRLIPSAPGVRQMPIATVPVAGLYRGATGASVQTTPIGSWRSGQLYVTAVRLTNQSAQTLDIDLQELRGQWIAASAQHTRLLARGSDWDTTAVYLVSDRPFEASR